MVAHTGLWAQVSIPADILRMALFSSGLTFPGHILGKTASLLEGHPEPVFCSPLGVARQGRTGHVWMHLQSNHFHTSSSSTWEMRHKSSFAWFLTLLGQFRTSLDGKINVILQSSSHHFSRFIAYSINFMLWVFQDCEFWYTKTFLSNSSLSWVSRHCSVRWGAWTLEPVLPELIPDSSTH